MQFKCKNQYYKGSTVKFYLTHCKDPYQVLPLWSRVDLRAMAMKGCSVFPKTPASLEPHPQIV